MAYSASCLADKALSSQVSLMAMNNRILVIEVFPLDVRNWCILYSEAGWLSGIFVAASRDDSLSLQDLRNTTENANPVGDIQIGPTNPYRIKAFTESAVHGICLRTKSDVISDGVQRICVFGDHSLRLFSLVPDHEASASAQFAIRELCDEKLSGDLVVAAKFLRHSRMAALLAHNSVDIYDDANLTLITKVRCMDSSILYSGILLGVETSNLIAIGGTVCSYLSFWAPAEAVSGAAPGFHKLAGYNGVIFGIDYCHSRRLLCSTSDDRSCRVWRCNFSETTTDLCSPSVGQWKSAEFSFLYALYGHEARVWHGRILSHFIVTVGEDTKCCIWSEEGQLVKQWSSHIGINTWSVSAVELADGLLIFTGGADGGISVREVSVSSDQPARREVKSSIPPGGHLVRRLAIVDELQYLVQVDGGLLYLVTISDPVTWTLLWDDVQLKQCVALRYDGFSACAAVVTCTGKISLISSVGQQTTPPTGWMLDLNCNCMEALWTGDTSTLIVSGPSGFIYIVTHVAGALSLRGTVPLPGKNLWITAAARQGDIIFCGDRGGSLRVLCGAVETWKDIYVGSHVHGQHEVSQITLTDDGKDEPFRNMTTSGRSGEIIFWRYQLDGTDRILLTRLRVLEPDKDIVEWVSGFHILTRSVEEAQRLLIFGFRSTKFASLDYTSQQTVLDVDCGGGHRSFAATVFTHSSTLRFAFVKTNGIHWIDSSIHGIGRDRVELKSALHGLQIWSMQELSSSPSDQCLFFATGSEDTTVKIIKIGMDRVSAALISPSVVAECRGHLSSVRVVRASRKFKHVLYSAGGRTQLRCWQCFDPLWSENIVSTAQWTPYPVVRKQWSDKSLIDPDTRIMDLSVCAFDQFELVAAGSSDGVVRIFALGSPNEITLIGEIGPFPWCVLQVNLIRLAGRLVLLTGGTKGFLDIRDIRNSVEAKLIPLDDFGETTVFECSADGDGEEGFTVRCHQSGIDAMDLLMEESGDCAIMATGGDDCAVSVLCLTGLDVAVKFGAPHAHSAQIGGIKLLRRNRLITASKDQLVKIWEVDYDRKEVVPLGCITTDVADLSCMTAVLTNQDDGGRYDDDDRSGHTCLAFVGAGFQLLNITAWLS